MLRKKLPVGIEDFEKLRKEDFYYIDKTGLISDLMSNWGEVNLFTRPRRFGKSLNMSMLKCFFEIGSDKSLFDGLKVSEDQELCDKYMGQYPVVFLSLKGVNGLDFKGAFSMLCATIRQEVQRLSFLQTSPWLSANEKSALNALTEPELTLGAAKSSLRLLTGMLEKHYGKKVILLIDEYDVPLDKAHKNGYYPQMTDLIRGMFDAALKTNSSLYFAVLTGCLRIAKESIFTGLNNLKMHSISDVRYEEYFGFTEAEVQKLLSDYDLTERYQEAREWYDGYRFGNQYIYCPWDVINYCDDIRDDLEAEPKAYWRNTSGNDMVRSLIDEASGGAAQADIERLIDGETITKTINEQLTYAEINKDIDNLWSLLYMTGYLTITKRPSGGLYSLKIPNREVREIYKSQVLEWFRDKAKAEAKAQIQNQFQTQAQTQAQVQAQTQTSIQTQTQKLTNLYMAFETGDTQAITELLSNQLYETVSYYDAYESFYHGFLLALLSTCSKWNVTSNQESGRGRSDILVWRKDRKVGFVVEVKNVREEKDLAAACDRAMRQIKEKDYPALLRRYGVKEIISYGIAFWDKSCQVKAEKLLG